MTQDYGFKFKIGDRVTPIECTKEAEIANAALPKDAYAKYYSPVLIIRGRWLEECYGGVQRHYDCRFIHRPSRTVGNMEIGYYAGTVVAGLHRFTEDELQFLSGEGDQPLQMTGVS